eukprot:TRINITY_DN17199_c0_g1_i4.p1 TRINITY_DN17199_c0_g1~~TRINITY_DN17199_c0_g1_i4.p1  ORF type:complete len:185 (+),score=35.14 TRINITY_DN17199_c0_g1_i4:59-613(+)
MQHILCLLALLDTALVLDAYRHRRDHACDASSSNTSVDALLATTAAQKHLEQLAFALDRLPDDQAAQGREALTDALLGDVKKEQLEAFRRQIEVDNSLGVHRDAVGAVTRLIDQVSHDKTMAEVAAEQLQTIHDDIKKLEVDAKQEAKTIGEAVVGGAGAFYAAVGAGALKKKMDARHSKPRSG